LRLISLQELLDPHGLLVRGAFEADGGCLVLVGNAGSALWSVFEKSAEYRDERPDPLDRWSRRIGDSVAGSLGAQAIYPFEGPPYPPFLRWAALAEPVSVSPISIYIHPEYGLWHAYRFALRFDEPLTGQAAFEGEVSPCETCVEKPCLQACPVRAFSTGSYEVEECMSYLTADEQSACRQGGCAARRACPEGLAYRYEPDHAKFHMEAFIRARLE
jgi:ferredoxin